MEFVGIGDLHLTAASGVGGLSAYLKEPDKFVADLVIDQPLKYAKRKGIKNIFLYGDICEKTRMSHSACIALLRILQQPFTFYIILGNHDKFGEDSDLGHSLEFFQQLNLPNVKIILHPTDLVIDKAPIRFLPWPHQNFSSKALNVAHLDVNGAKSDSGRMFESDKLTASSATIVMGHIHTHQRIRNTHYSGTLYQTNFGESLEKFFHHGIYEGGGWSIESVPVKSVYRLHTCEVRTRSDLKGIPASEYDLVKLIMLEGSKLASSDYAHLNVVRQRPVKGGLDLEQARVEDLKTGSEINFSTDDFVLDWIDGQPVGSSLKKRAIALRKRILT